MYPVSDEDSATPDLTPEEEAELLDRINNYDDEGDPIVPTTATENLAFARNLFPNSTLLATLSRFAPDALEAFTREASGFGFGDIDFFGSFENLYPVDINIAPIRKMILEFRDTLTEESREELMGKIIQSMKACGT